jgi:hypothetical protein
MRLYFVHEAHLWFHGSVSVEENWEVFEQCIELH